MALFVLLSALIFGSGYTMQEKYDYCKSIEFKAEYCETQKKIYESTK